MSKKDKKLKELLNPVSEPIEFNERVRADRYNENKIKVGLVHPILIKETAKVLEYGSKKYSKDNWKKGDLTTSILDSLLRHIYAYQEGEDLDSETNLCHLAHAACNIMFLMYNKENNPEMDDRYKTLEKGE